MPVKYKIFDSEVKAFDENELTVEHFISTERKDRGDEVMRADGMNIIGKPVVLLMHGRSALGGEPVAKPIWIKRGSFNRKKGVVAKTKFFDDENGVGRRLWQKTKEGYMPNWSIGYDVLRYEIKKDFVDILEWDLLEYSMVGVPMNPDAQTIYAKSYENLETVYQDIGELALENEGEKIDILPVRFFIMPEKHEEEKLSEKKAKETEHSICLNAEENWDSIIRQDNKFGEGIHAIWGIKEDTVELAWIRFDSAKYTIQKALAWANSSKYPYWKDFENAKNIIQPDIEEKGVIAYKKTPLASEGTSWDAAAEVKKAEVSDLKVMCVYFEGDGSNKTQYKGPHHKAGGSHECVWAGVSALATVIMGARGGMNVPQESMAGIKRHVAGHYRDFDKGDPPWEKDFLSIEEVKDLLSTIPYNQEVLMIKTEDDQEIIDRILEKMEEKGLFVKATGEPASDSQKDNKESVDNNPRRRLIIKNDIESEKRQKSENANFLANVIAEAVGTSFRNGIRKLLGKVD